MEIIASHNGEMSLREISRKTKIPVGTLTPILKTLAVRDYLDVDPQSKLYSIGLRAFLSGIPFVHASDTYQGIRSVLTDMSQRTGETTHYCTLDGGNVLYVSKVESSQPIRMYSDIGKQLPAYGTAVGKALLSDMDLEELKALYPEGLKPLTANTITSFDVLYEQLLEVRATGFSYECEESNVGIRCIATPVRVNGKIVGAVSVVIPIFRYSEQKREKIESLLVKGSKVLAEVLPMMDLAYHE